MSSSWHEMLCADAVTTSVFLPSCTTCVSADPGWVAKILLSRRPFIRLFAETGSDRRSVERGVQWLLVFCCVEQTTDV